MKVILQQDIPGTGKKDQVIEASDGFARNYLFPRKLARPATEENLHAIEQVKAAQAHKKEQDKEKAREYAKRLAELTVSIPVRCGEKGRLYGKVTNQEVADALKAQFGIEVDKRKITVPLIKEVGEATCEIKLFAEVSTTLKLHIIAKEK